jgi:sorting and assembly machinery component 37
MLTWPQQWLIPQKLRDSARKRSEHLGLSSLDVGGISEQADEDPDKARTKGTSRIPKSLMSRPKETISNMLGVKGGQNQIRLDAITSDFLEPLCELVQKHGSQSWVFGTEKATSLDCLLLGYMSLASPILRPPHGWLQDALSKKSPVLSQWRTCFRQECFGGPVDATDVTSRHASIQSDLPWHPPAAMTVMDAGWSILRASGDALPFVSASRPGQRDTVCGNEVATTRALVSPLYLTVAGSVMGIIAALFFVGVRGNPIPTHHLFGHRRVLGNWRMPGLRGV